MRKTLLSLTVLAGVVGLGVGAQAATVNLAPAVARPAHVQTVQYYGYPHAHGYYHQRRHEEWVRHHEWHRWHHSYAHSYYR